MAAPGDLLGGGMGDALGIVAPILAIAIAVGIMGAVAFLIVWQARKRGWFVKYPIPVYIFEKIGTGDQSNQLFDTDKARLVKDENGITRYQFKSRKNYSPPFSYGQLFLNSKGLKVAVICKVNPTDGVVLKLTPTPREIKCTKVLIPNPAFATFQAKNTGFIDEKLNVDQTPPEFFELYKFDEDNLADAISISVKGADLITTPSKELFNAAYASMRNTVLRNHKNDLWTNIMPYAIFGMLIIGIVMVLFVVGDNFSKAAASSAEAGAAYAQATSNLAAIQGVNVVG